MRPQAVAHVSVPSSALPWLCRASLCLGSAVLRRRGSVRCFASPCRCPASHLFAFANHRPAMPLLCSSPPSFAVALQVLALPSPCYSCPCHREALQPSRRHSPAARPLAFATLPFAEPLLRFAALCLRYATLGFAFASHCKPLLCPRAAMLAVAMPSLCMSSRSNPTPWRRRTQPSRRSAGLCRRDSSRS